MKSIQVLIAILMVVECWSANNQIDVETAVSKRLIRAEMQGTGGYQGYCVRFSLENISGHELQLFIPAGVRLNSLEDEHQDLVVVENIMVHLGSKEKKSIRVKSFCCQASRKSPSAGARFQLAAADSNLRRVAAFLGVRGFSDDVVQHAIWSVSDNRPVGVVGNSTDTAAANLRKFLCVVKNEPVPWYDLHARIIHYSNGRMEARPYQLTAALSYDTETTEYGRLTVRDSSGRQVGIIREQWLTAGKDNRLDLTIPLGGLGAGKYRIELHTSAGMLVKKEFIL